VILRQRDYGIVAVLSLERDAPPDLAERGQVLAPVVKLCGARFGTIGHILGGPESRTLYSLKCAARLPAIGCGKRVRPRANN
jgi:hypothetical protein